MDRDIYITEFDVKRLKPSSFRKDCRSHLMIFSILKAFKKSLSGPTLSSLKPFLEIS